MHKKSNYFNQLINFYSHWQIVIENIEQTDNACYMLVASPDGVCSIRRVSLQVTRDDTRIAFSENVGKRFPESFSLRKNYGNVWERAVVGKVVAAFACGQRSL